MESKYSSDSYGEYWRNVDGELHRENDLPAYVSKNKQNWFINGGIHREHAPAIIYNDGGEYWYLNDVFYEVVGKMPLHLFLAYVKWNIKKEFYYNSV